ncbi:hypothetical protein ACO0QE_003814 [Hanseniaspora vineae]
MSILVKDQYSVTKSTFVSVLYVAAIYSSNLYLKRSHFKKTLKSKSTQIHRNKKQDENSEEEAEQNFEGDQEENKLKRDNPIVIKSRMKFVSFVIVILLLTMYSTHGDWKQLIGAQYHVLKSGTETVVINTTWAKYVGQIVQLSGVYLSNH